MTTEPTPGALPETNATPVPGDGVVTIVLPGEGVSMAGEVADISPGMANVIMNQMAGDITSSSNRVRIGADAVMVAITATVGQNLKDVGAVEGRTISGILATPLASPTKTA